jgi:flagellar hook-associated protein 1
MPTIFSNLDLAKQSILAQQYALTVTQRNVANINNPSYTRQEVVFTGQYPDTESSGMPKVILQSNRDRYLDYNITKEQSGLGQSNVESEAMKQIDVVMNNLDGNGLQESLANFFNSFGSLSSNPTDLNLRQQVLTSSNTLTNRFRQIASSLKQIQLSQDQEVQRTVAEVNSITAQIADINKKIAIAHRTNVDEEEFTLRDERQRLVEDLAQDIKVSYFENDAGSLMVTTEQGVYLVMDQKSYGLDLVPVSESAFNGVAVEGKDITESLETGSLGGYMKMRDETISEYLSTLDDLAAGIINRVNTVHASGADLDNNAGGDFFVPFIGTDPTSNKGAASSICMALTDPRGVAAAAVGGGMANNENAKLLAAISTDKLFSEDKETAGELYAGLIFRVGTDAKEADDGLNTQNNLLEQLKNQRSSATGVSMDEEAVNMLKYQRTYQACARFANVLDNLCQDILQYLGS